ncbi:MAG: sensor histidine kinase [Bacteriovoracaceae bacterium]
MELNRTLRWFYILTALWVVSLLGLGSWWLYLVFKLHTVVKKLNLPTLASESSFLNMIKWEGTFFFIFLVFLGVSLFILYFRDMKKTKAIGAFFASLSHELKTPLASMRLQAEVIKDLIDDESHDHEQLSGLTTRLIEDTYKFESELEKSLQLARIEQDGTLNLSPIQIERLIKRQQQKIPNALSISIKAQVKEVMADEMALSVILRNLFENTLRHNPESSQVEISISQEGHWAEIIYDDFGKKFQGDATKLGDLFYKFDSIKGSGIGLYLIKQLTRKMRGEFYVLNRDRLKFRILLPLTEGELSEH